MQQYLHAYLTANIKLHKISTWFWWTRCFHFLLYFTFATLSYNTHIIHSKTIVKISVITTGCTVTPQVILALLYRLSPAVAAKKHFYHCFISPYLPRNALFCKDYRQFYCLLWDVWMWQIRAKFSKLLLAISCKMVSVGAFTFICKREMPFASSKSITFIFWPKVNVSSLFNDKINSAVRNTYSSYPTAQWIPINTITSLSFLDTICKNVNNPHLY